MDFLFHYFKVTGGAVRAAYDRWHALRESQKQARQSLCQEFEAKGCYASTRKVVGMFFEDESKVPAGWKREPGEPTVWRPAGSSKEMVALRKRFMGYPLAGAEEFQFEVLGKADPFRFMDGLRIRHMLPEMVGDQLILLVPKLSESDQTLHGNVERLWTPPDDGCVLLKTSEYWALKEAVPAEKGN